MFQQILMKWVKYLDELAIKLQKAQLKRNKEFNKFKKERAKRKQ